MHDPRSSAALRPAIDRPPVSQPPRRRRVRRGRFDFSALSGFVGRNRGFWSGHGGVIASIVTGSFVVLLLFGWVWLWLDQPDSPSVPLLIAGCVGFTLVLALIATLQNRLQAHGRLRAAEAAFLAGFSHSFRTPISAIRAAAQAMERPGLSEDQRKKLLAAIVRETRRLGLRVDNVLETTRQEVEGGGFSREVVSLRHMLEELLAELEPNVTARGGALERKIPERLLVRGDARALRLLFENLLDNALKFSNEIPRIAVSAEERESDVFVRIEDEGQGFAVLDRPDQRRRFRSGDGGRTGLGIGLAIARSVARGHGGDVHLFGKGTSQGACVEVWLPRAEGER